MSEFRFSKENGSFYYRCNGRIVYMADDLAFFIDRSETGTVLLKHGPAEAMNAHFGVIRKRYQDAGLDEMLATMMVVEGRDWPVAELNKFIQITGYIGLYLDRRESEVVREAGASGVTAPITASVAPPSVPTPPPVSARVPALKAKVSKPIPPGSILIVGSNR